jgi:hypothetical protein
MCGYRYLQSCNGKEYRWKERQLDMLDRMQGHLQWMKPQELLMHPARSRTDTGKLFEKGGLFNRRLKGLSKLLGEREVELWQDVSDFQQYNRCY